MKIALAQINPTLGNFSANADKILSYIRRASNDHADLVVFPEASLFGYHPFDLLEQQELVKSQLKELKKIEKQIPKNISALIGLFTINPEKRGRPYFNTAALVKKGQKTKYFNKQLLPTFDVFDEARFIEPGSQKNNCFELNGKKVQLLICEDMWAWPDKNGKSLYAENPTAKIKGTKFDLVINMSASPFYYNKLEKRLELARQTSHHFKAPTVYVNMVGGQDEIVYDGKSFAISKSGQLLAVAQSFEEHLMFVDFDDLPNKKIKPAKQSSEEELRQAIVVGIRDFVEKTGLKGVHLGLSGGVDSALVACLAVDALGPKKVACLALPTEFNDQRSLKVAQRLAKNLSVDLIEIPIQRSFETVRDILDNELGIEQFSLVHENLQARLRGMFLMAFANQRSSLLLSTSNKSEYAAGYSTLYGDMCGGLAPIGDLTKKQVYSICRLYNSHQELIPNWILERAPSAELRPNQKDQDSLPEYEKLDDSVDRLVCRGESVKSATDKWLLPVLLKTEFKRWQAPPILKVSEHSFGRGRRWPIAHQALTALKKTAK